MELTQIPGVWRLQISLWLALSAGASPPARQAKLSKITIKGNTYWSTKSGGKRAYFGNVAEVTRKEAEAAFLNHRKALLENPRRNVCAGVSVTQLIDEYLEWVSTNLSANNYASKKSCLGQWVIHRVGDSGQEQPKRLHELGKRVGELAAEKVTKAHLDDFLATRKKRASAARHVGRWPRKANGAAVDHVVISKRSSIGQYPVSTTVNSRKKQGEQCIEPVAASASWNCGRCGEVSILRRIAVAGLPFAAQIRNTSRLKCMTCSSTAT